MDNNFGNFTYKNKNKNININKHSSSIEIKLNHGKENQICTNIIVKSSHLNNRISLFSNETKISTFFQQNLEYPNTNINKININKFNKAEINKYTPSLNPKQFKDTIEPIIFLGTYETTISNFDIIINDKISKINKNQNISTLTFLEETKYESPEMEYYEDILSELLIEEEKNSLYKKCIYINYQKDLDNQKRAKLISFIYQISKLFKFKNRTVFLAVQTMDRFLCKEKINFEFYNLLCICCIVIASKFNEIYYPTYKDIVTYFEKTKNYTASQALSMELLILRTINYDLFPIFPMYFFDIISQKAKLNEIEYYLGSLMIELIQFDFYLYPYKNSILAQTVFCKVISLTKRINDEPLNILKNIFHDENYELNSETIFLIQKASFVIDELLQNLNSDYFEEIYKKYSQPEILGDSVNYFLNIYL